MISEDIIEKLICFTDEEIGYLNGIKEVDKSIFLNSNTMTVDCNKIFRHRDQQINVSKHARFCEYPAHKHNFLELMYVYSGAMTHTINGSDITLHKGEMLLLNQNVEHSIKYCNENDIIFNFIIKLEFIEFLPKISNQKSIVFDFIYSCLYSTENIDSFLIFRITDSTIIRNYIDKIITNIYNPGDYNEMELKLLVGLLMIELMKQPKNMKIHKTGSYDKMIINSILEYVINNFQEGSLTRLSKIIHQPTYKICKVVKDETGKTFKQLIQEERLKKAVCLLENTRIPITQIMLEVGYENITYFYKIFKQKHGVTPSQLRMSHTK